MMQLLKADYNGAIIKSSPNFNDRRVIEISKNESDKEENVKFLILHYTGMKTAEAALKRLSDPKAQVSCHYVVLENGDVIQMVSESKRAWHAGESEWQGINDINSRSIGIEIVNQGPVGNYPDFPVEQVNSVIQLCKDIVKRHHIEPRYVLAHSDIAPLRKEDPGEKFPWEKLYQEGVGHWVKPTAIGGGRFMSMGETGRPVEALQAMLLLYGYTIQVDGIFDEKTESVIRAFQRHFRPQKVDGIADYSTIDTLHRLLGTLKALS